MAKALRRASVALLAIPVLIVVTVLTWDEPAPVETRPPITRAADTPPPWAPGGPKRPVHPPRPPPQPYAGALTAEEGLLLAKLQTVTGRSLALGSGLMAAAQSSQSNPPTELGIVYLAFKTANIGGVGQSAEAVLTNASRELLPTDGKPYNYVGLGYKTDGTRHDFFYIIAVV